jgi:hypothetical protein
MAFTNKLKNQVDMPVWEWCRFPPAVSSALSTTCAADNSLFHVQHGRYIYYMQAATNFMRYDTISDTWQQLATPHIAPAIPFSSMSFAGGVGYFSRPISLPSSTTIQGAFLSGKVFKGFNIRIIGGTGAGQQRVVTDVADVVIADSGTATAGAIGSLTDSNKNWQINQWVGYQVKIVLSTGAAATGGAIQTRRVLYNTATVITFADSARCPEDPWSNTPILTTAFGTVGAGSAYQLESSVLTVNSAFSTALDSTSRFVIQTGGLWLASAQATSLYSLQYYDIQADQWFTRTANTGPVITTPTDGTIQRFGENASIWITGVATGSQTTTVLQDTTQSFTVNQWVGYWIRIISGTGAGQIRLIASNDTNSVTWSSAGTAPDSTSYYTIEGFDAGTATSATSASGTASGTASSISGNILTVGGSVTGSFQPGMILSGTGVGTMLTFANATCTISTSVVTVGSTTGIFPGMVLTMVSGTGTLAAGISTVITVNSSTTFTISQNVTAALAATNVILLSGGPGTSGGLVAYASAAGATSSGTLVTVTTTANLVVGMGVIVVAGTGLFVAGTTITAVNSTTTFTVSVTPTTGLSGGASIVVASWPFTPYITAQLTGSAGGAGTYSIYPNQNVTSTTITGTGTPTLVDSTKAWTTNRWNGQAVRITGGTGAGQIRSIVGTNPTSLVLNRDWMVQPDSTSTYVIHGDTDKILLSVGIAAPGTAALFVYNQEADTLSLGRTLDWGVARGLSAQLLNAGQTYGDAPAVACSGAVYTASSGSIATTAGSASGTTATVTFSATVFPVGSFVTLAGCTPSAYNGTFRVTASFAGSATFTILSSNPGAITVQGTIAVAASLLVTSVNSHNFISGQKIGLRGDTGAGASVNNLAAGYECFANSATTFTLGITAASASATVPAQSTTRLFDASKNWVPNQWVGCTVVYSTVVVAQATGIAAETAMQIVGNDANSLTLVFAAASAPAQGISRYVINPPAFHQLKNVLGALDGGIAIGSAAIPNSTTLLVDLSKQWTSVATSCSSTGTTLITTTGNTNGLQVGMYVGISAGTGTMVVGAVAGTHTPVTVTAINSATTFTVSAIPATNLSAATVIATKWFPGAFVNRRLRITGGTGINQELTITASTASTLTFGVSTAPVTGQSTYAILQAPGKGLGINMNWNFGQSDTTRRGSYVYLPRGNGLVGIDRLNMQTDTWELFQNSPGFETLTQGSMYAYDGGDRIYFTKDITQRMYYLDIDKNIVHGAGMFPYTAGSVITGNRMEIFSTADGLKYLWLNRHANVECFRQLLFY